MSRGLLLDSIGGKIIRQKVNRKFLQSRPKGVSIRITILSHGDVLIGVSSTAFLTS